MLIPALFFYLFAGVCVASAVMVIASRNPVHSVLFLILAFVNASGLFILMGAEFLAMILVVVYVGAVAVLFLFVIMMLDVDFAELRQGFLNYLPFGMLVGAIVLAELLLVTGGWVINPDVSRTLGSPIPANVSNTEALGLVLYTKYIHYFQVAGVVLLVAMIGAIVLTLRHKPNVKRQDISAQNARTKAMAMEVVKVAPGQGCRIRRRGRPPNDHYSGALSGRRGHPVHDRHPRHLPQPQERDRHLDVDRADPARREHQSGRVLDLPERHRRPGVCASGAHGGCGGGRDRAGGAGRILPQSRHDRGRRHQPDEGLRRSR
jgi:NADH-quinone oxidoreductase subunit J